MSGYWYTQPQQAAKADARSIASYYYGLSPPQKTGYYLVAAGTFIMLVDKWMADHKKGALMDRPIRIAVIGFLGVMVLNLIINSHPRSILETTSMYYKTS
jgi:hypothetical protein